MKDEEIRILEISLRVMTDQLDILVGACMDENGKPKVPSARDLAASRGYLPPYAKNSFKKN